MLTREKNGSFRGPRQGLVLNISSNNKKHEFIAFTFEPLHPRLESNRGFDAIGRCNLSGPPMVLSRRCSRS
jgi:hypothetical protein